MALPAKAPRNWAGAFASYCQGAPLEEIAQIFEIELTTLHSRVANERWVALRASLPLGDTPSTDKETPSVVQTKMLAIQANREKNLAAWAVLREDALAVIGKLRDGSLTLEKQWHNRGLVTRADVGPSLADRVNLATYLRTISDGTYRALGDMAAQEKPGQDALAGGAAAGVPHITIILPACIAAPREMRQAAGEGQVIDLRGTGEALSSATGEAPPPAQE